LGAACSVPNNGRSAAQRKRILLSFAAFILSAGLGSMLLAARPASPSDPLRRRRTCYSVLLSTGIHDYYVLVVIITE
jgi:hypothetical protein